MAGNKRLADFGWTRHQEVFTTKKLPVFLGSFAHAVNDGSVYIVPALIPYMVNTLRFTHAEAAFVWTLLSLMSSLPQPLFGIAADRSGRFGLAAIGLFIATAAMAAVGALDNYYLLLLVASIGGIGTAIAHPILAAIVARTSGGRRGAGMSAFSLGGNIGFAIAPLIFPLLLLQYDRAASWFILPVGIATSVALYLGTRGLSSKRVAHGPEASEDKARWPTLPLSLLSTTVILRGWVYQVYVAFLPLYMLSQGYTLPEGSGVLSIVLFAAAFGSVVGGALSDYISPKWITVGSMVATVVTLAPALFTSGTISVALLSLSGFFLMASFAVTVVMAQELMPRQQALASGLMLGLGIGIGGLGTSITGWTIDVFGMQTAMLSMVAVALAGALVMIPYREVRRHKQQQHKQESTERCVT